MIPTLRNRVTLPGGLLNQKGVELIAGLRLAGYSNHRIRKWLKSNGRNVASNIIQNIGEGRRTHRDTMMRVRLELDAAERRAVKDRTRSEASDAHVARLKEKLAQMEVEE